MQSESIRYRLAAGVRLKFASWENEGSSVVFNVDAGETLLVTEEAAAVLQALQKSPSTVLELLGGDIDLGDGPDSGDAVEPMVRLLTSLFQQGLVERAVT